MTAEIGSGVEGTAVAWQTHQPVHVQPQGATLAHDQLLLLNVQTPTIPVPAAVIGSTVATNGDLLTLWGSHNLPYFVLLRWNPVTLELSVVDAQEWRHPVETVTGTFIFLLGGRWTRMEGAFFDPHVTNVHEDTQENAVFLEGYDGENIAATAPTGFTPVGQDYAHVDTRNHTIRVVAHMRYFTASASHQYIIVDEGLPTEHLAPQVIFGSQGILEGAVIITADDTGISVTWSAGTIDFPPAQQEGYFSAGSGRAEPGGGIVAHGVTDQGERFGLYFIATDPRRIGLVTLLDSGLGGSVISDLPAQYAAGLPTYAPTVVPGNIGNHILRAADDDTFYIMDGGPAALLLPGNSPPVPIPLYPYLDDVGMLRFTRVLDRAAVPNLVLARPADGKAGDDLRLYTVGVPLARAPDILHLPGQDVEVRGVGLNSVDVTLTADLHLPLPASVAVTPSTVPQGVRIDLGPHALPYESRLRRLYPTSSTADPNPNAPDTVWRGVLPGPSDLDLKSVPLRRAALRGPANTDLGLTFPTLPPGFFYAPVDLVMTFRAAQGGTLSAYTATDSFNTSNAAFTAARRWQQRRLMLTISDDPALPLSVTLRGTVPLQISSLAVECLEAVHI